MKLKVLFVFNNTTWTTIEPKLSEIRGFFSPKVELVIDTHYSFFDNIPFETIKTTEGTGSQTGVDHEGTTEAVAGWWYDQNISKPNSSYDIIVLCLSEGDKKGRVTSTGLRGDRSEGPVEITMFGGDEHWRTYVNGVDVGNNFVIFTCHEISHAIYMLQGGVDNTHLYFYSGQPTKVLEDYKETIPNTADTLSLLQRIAELMRIVLGLQAQLKELNKAGSKIDLFCQAIKEHEGYYPPGPNYPKGSVSYRNNNPFNLRYIGQPKAIGQDSNHFAIFATVEDGYETGKQMIINACTGKSKIYFPDDTIYEFFGKYAPSFENNTLAYAQTVAKKCGVTINTHIKDLL